MFKGPLRKCLSTQNGTGKSQNKGFAFSEVLVSPLSQPLRSEENKLRVKHEILQLQEESFTPDMGTLVSCPLA